LKTRRTLDLFLSRKREKTLALALSRERERGNGGAAARPVYSFSNRARQYCKHCYPQVDDFHPFENVEQLILWGLRLPVVRVPDENESAE
jgi:hypothetical protein